MLYVAVSRVITTAGLSINPLLAIDSLHAMQPCEEVQMILSRCFPKHPFFTKSLSLSLSPSLHLENDLIAISSIPSLEKLFVNSLSEKKS
jgi:hypothetical protein